MFDALPALDGLVGQAFLTATSNGFGDAFHVLDVVRADLHHAAVAIGEEEKVFAVLLIYNHVDRAIHVTEFGDGFTLNLGAWFQITDGELYQRRAGIGSDE